MPPKRGHFWGCQLRPASTSKIVIDKENPTTKSQYTSKSTSMRKKKKSFVGLLNRNFRNFHNEKYFVRSKCRLKYVPSECHVGGAHITDSRADIKFITVHYSLPKKDIPSKAGSWSLCYSDWILKKLFVNVQRLNFRNFLFYIIFLPGLRPAAHSPATSEQW